MMPMPRKVTPTPAQAAAAERGARVAELYADTPNKEIAKALGITAKRVAADGLRLGLVKSYRERAVAKPKASMTYRGQE